MPTADRPPMHLQAAAGQPLTITLDGNPGGGWLWHAPAAPPGCQLAEITPASAGAGEGGAVQQRFVFSSAAAGTHPLRFEQRRAWDSAAQAAHAVQAVHISVA
jgi:predicted secreted protein